MTDGQKKYGRLPMNALSLNPIKGSMEQTPLTAWDAVEDCDKEKCDLRKLCPYAANTKQKIKRCQIQSRYITRVTTALLNNIGSRANEMQWQRIGLHLIPLYSHLVKLKMLSLTVQIASQTKSGPKIHPVFREIRETLKAIRAERESIGIDKLIEDIENPDRFLYGDGDYVDGLSEMPPDSREEDEDLEEVSPEELPQDTDGFNEARDDFADI